MESAYAAGRRECVLQPSAGGEGCLYAAQLMDGQTFTGHRFENCTFLNVSFKGATLERCEFQNCVFVACYFRLATFNSSTFGSSKFIDCEFPKPSIRNCDLRSTRFIRSFIGAAQIVRSLPDEPNLRQAVVRDLEISAEQAGETREARSFRLEAIRAQNAMLWGAVRGESQWYRDHYSGFARWRAFGRLAINRLNGALWGHGERFAVLLLNLTIVALIVFPFFWWVFRAGLTLAGDDRRELGLMDYLLTSIDSVLLAAAISPTRLDSTATRWLASIEGMVGLVFTGLFISYLLRWITRQ